MELYSKRNNPLKDHLTYSIPHFVRNRIMYNFHDIIEKEICYSSILQELSVLMLKEYGYLGNGSSKDISHHIMECGDEKFLDLIESVFVVKNGFLTIRSCLGNEAIKQINRVFREEGIGYEITPINVEIGEVQKFDGNPIGIFKPINAFPLNISYPQIIKKINQITHAMAVSPCLNALSDRRFATANSEILEAHKYYKDSKWEASIVECCKSLETVLKTICTIKKLAYVENKSTLSDLVKICKDDKVFFPFYAPIFEAIGTMRNKLAAHGKEPTPEFVPTQIHAEHMINFTSSQILFLIGLL